MSLAELELRSQFQALESTTHHILERKAELAAALHQVNRVCVLGCGSSYSVAKSSARQFAQRTGIAADAVAAGDLLVNFDSYQKVLSDSAILLLSRSGSTSELLAAARRCRKQFPKALIISICAVAAAPIAAVADISIEIPWAFDQSVCQTRTVSNLYAAALLLVGIKAGDEGLLADIAGAADKAVAFCAAVEEDLDQLAAANWESAVVLADSGMAGLAEEGALAFKEIARTPSSFYRLLDVRHGPTVMIDRQTLVLATISRGDRQLQADLVADLQTRSEHLLTFSCGSSMEVPGVAAIRLPITIHDDVSAIFMLYCIQLLSLKRALIRGLDPDRPEGLAAWIELKTGAP